MISRRLPINKSFCKLNTRLTNTYQLARKALFKLDAETAHHWSMSSLRLAERTGILKKLLPEPIVSSSVALMGLNFPNRIGLAAGLDKEGNTIDALGRTGFGFIEVGTLTPRPQEGNAKPRLFRLVPDEAIINRMGFNNPGIDAGVKNVLTTKVFSGPIGLNIGKNKDTPNERAADDYLICLRKAFPVADYVVVNLSSPNTPGLRDLQSEEASARLLDILKAEQDKLSRKHGKFVPLLFKVAPDLDPIHISQLAKVFKNGGLDGLIATNTTITRTGVENYLQSAEAGGLSGKPLNQLSNRVISAFASELGQEIPIIGVGGISSPADAQGKIDAGAALVQIYTAFIYQGPELVHSVASALESKKTPLAQTTIS